MRLKKDEGMVKEGKKREVGEKKQELSYKRTRVKHEEESFLSNVNF